MVLLSRRGEGATKYSERLSRERKCRSSQQDGQMLVMPGLGEIFFPRGEPGLDGMALSGYDSMHFCY